MQCGARWGFRCCQHCQRPCPRPAGLESARCLLPLPLPQLPQRRCCWQARCASLPGRWLDCRAQGERAAGASGEAPANVRGGDAPLRQQYRHTRWTQKPTTPPPNCVPPPHSTHAAQACRFGGIMRCAALACASGGTCCARRRWGMRRNTLCLHTLPPPAGRKAGPGSISERMAVPQTGLRALAGKTQFPPACVCRSLALHCALALLRPPAAITRFKSSTAASPVRERSPERSHPAPE